MTHFRAGFLVSLALQSEVKLFYAGIALLSCNFQCS